MKLTFITGALSTLLLTTTTFASEYPDGGITFYNASDKKITAQVSNSNFGSFDLSGNEKRDIPYKSLSHVCSATPTKCTAHFYVNDNHAGSATINVQTGKLLSMKLSMKVKTSKGQQQVLRSIVIQ